MNMDIDQIAELDRLIELLEGASKSLEELYINIDGYDRHAAAAKIATYAGLTKGVSERLKELKG